jgi:hypothetical protein
VKRLRAPIVPGLMYIYARVPEYMRIHPQHLDEVSEVKISEKTRSVSDRGTESKNVTRRGVECPYWDLRYRGGDHPVTQDDIKNILCNLPNSVSLKIKLGLMDAHCKLSDYYYQVDASPFYTWAACMWIIVKPILV